VPQTLERRTHGRRWPFALGALFALALIWRLAYLQRYLASPLADSLRVDERSDWDWATFLLSHHFVGVNAFFQGPLYPYALAAIRALIGSQLGPVLVVQAVIGSLSVVLLADAARRVTRPWIALVIGASLALYQLSVMLDGLILGESLAFFLESALIWMWCRAVTGRAIVRAAGPRAAPAAAPPSHATFGAMGALTGLLANARGTGALMMIPTLWLALKAGAPSRKQAWDRIAVSLASFGVFILMSLAWNWHACHEFIPLTYNFGFNLYVGNNPDADGSYVAGVGGSRLGGAPSSAPDGGAGGDTREYLRKERGLDLTPAQSSRYWAGEAAGFVLANPLRAIELAGAKLVMLWNAREIPQLERLELFRLEAGPLGLPIAGTFAFFGILGLIGLALVDSSPGAGAILRLDVGAIVIGVLPFFVVDRYRYHLVPALAVAGAMGIDALIRRARAPGSRRAALATMAASAFLVLWRLPREERARVEWGLTFDLGMRWLDHDRPDLASQQFRHAIEIENESAIGTDSDLAARRNRAQLHFNYASALHALGQNDDALRWIERAARGDPGESRYIRALADAYALAGRTAEADSMRLRLRSLVGGDPETLVSEGWQAAREERRADAESLFRAAVAADQTHYGAWGALVRIQIERGEWAAAESSLARAGAAGMPRPALLAHEALLYANSGDAARARRALDALSPADVASDRLLEGLADAARRRLASPAPR